MKNYVIGLEFGSDSVRAVFIDTENGYELASDVCHYKRCGNKEYCNADINQFRQHPLEHIEGLESNIKAVVAAGKVAPSQINSICNDTTGSSPIPVAEVGTTVALTVVLTTVGGYVAVAGGVVSAVSQLTTGEAALQPSEDDQQ
jgi:L-ribulokinase